MKGLRTMMRRALALLALLMCAASSASVTTGNAMQNRFVYAANWAQYREGACKWFPEQLPAALATHVVFAYAKLAPGSDIATVEWNDEVLYAQTQALKLENPELKTLIALGGWSHNAPDAPTLHLFSEAVATAASRSTFITNVLAFTAKYGFDGISIDWLYPGDKERGGEETDAGGLACFAAELRSAAESAGRGSFLIALAAAASAPGYSGLDLPKLHPSLDFINVLAYDYHGSWEDRVNYHSPWVDAEGGSLDILDTLDYYITQGEVPPAKLSLSLALSGRSWTLDSPEKKSGIGAPASGPGTAGLCTKEAGFLSWREVKAMIAGGADVTLDPAAKAAYLVQGDQWVSFDLPQTIYMKIEAAREMGLGGISVWAADLDDESNSMMELVASGEDPGPFETATIDPTFPRNVAYVSNWAQYRPGSCSWLPEQLPAELVTHVNFAFAKMAPGHQLNTTEWNDAALYQQTQLLKTRNPNLKTLIAVGGWDHNNPNATTAHLFSKAVATTAARKKFIASILAFTAKYGFDGIDFDWEYPAVPERGGQPSDTPGLTALLAELRAAATAAGRRDFLITMATAADPAGYSGLDLAGLHPSVDFFNLMTYDYHGSWEKSVNYHTPWVDTREGGTHGIQNTLDHYIKNGTVPPFKITLGLGLYGKSWTLDHEKKTKVGSPASLPGAAGACTGAPGTLSWREIEALIAGGAKVNVDSTAMAAYLVQGDQWVSFDAPETIFMKIKAARAAGMGGTMVWAADYDTADHSMLTIIAWARANPEAATETLRMR